MIRRLHLHRFASGQFAIFDHNENLVVDCTAGEMSEADARMFITAHDSAKFWEAVSYILIASHIVAAILYGRGDL